MPHIFQCKPAHSAISQLTGETGINEDHGQKKLSIVFRAQHWSLTSSKYFMEKIQYVSQFWHSDYVCSLNYLWKNNDVYLEKYWVTCLIKGLQQAK